MKLIAFTWLHILRNNASSSNIYHRELFEDHIIRDNSKIFPNKANYDGPSSGRGCTESEESH